MALDEHAVESLIAGVFDVNRRLEEIMFDVRLIRLYLLEEDDGEEEETDY